MSTGDDRAWRALLATGIAVMAAYVLAARSERVQDVVFLGWLTVAAGLLIVRLRRDRPARPRLWQALVAGVGVYVVAAYLWYLSAIGFGPMLQFPSVVDVLYFVSYVLVGSYLLATIGSRRAEDEGEQRLAVVDAAIFTNALLALVWVTIIQPNIAAASGTAAEVVAVVYPAFTALLFALAMRIALGGIVPRGVDLLLVGWIGAELCSSIIYGYTSANDTFRHGHPVFLGWIGSYTALAALAVHPRFGTVPRHAVPAPRTSSQSRLVLLLAAALLPIAVAMIHGADSFLLVDAAVGFVLVAARLSLVSGDLEEQRRLAGELSRMSDELRHRALHDSLTGLGNRALVMEALERAIRRRTTTPGVGTALLLLDLDGFKTINDTLGHEAGDNVLIEVGARLLGSVRSADTVARLGGDEFAVILEDVSAEEALRSARRIIEVLREPVQFPGKALAICASVGLHIVEEEASDSQIAVRNADLAMYAAKALGGDRYELYQAELHHAFLVRHELEMQLREAVGGEQLDVYYQPIVDLATQAFVGVEALLRWRHSGRGLLLPREFMDVAESSSVIVTIGRWVLEEVCRQYVRWRDAFQLPDGFRVAVNVSRRQLTEPLIADNVARILQDTGCDARALVFEVTETAIANRADLAENLEKIRSFGVTIAMDDFGTGYSSLDQLRHLPIDMLKIDRSFVARIADRREDLDLVAVIVKLADSLKKQTIAEGVETPEQLARLRSLDVDLAQGNLFGLPVLAGEISRGWLSG